MAFRRRAQLIEFACKVAGAKLVMILGHSRCGAVMGALDRVKLGNLSELLERLAPAVETAAETVEPDQRNSQNAELVQHTAERNVLLTMQALRDGSSVLAEMLDAGELALAGAMYDVATGEVRMLESSL